MQDYWIFPKWHTFIWSAETLLKTSNNGFFLHPHLPCFFPNLLQCKFVINKINLIFHIITTFSMKKSKILTSIPQILIIYHNKNLCHHVKKCTLFYLWLKYGAIWTIIVSPFDSFLIKMHSEIRFQSHFLGHLRTCLNHPNHKKSPPF
jgi:hypothetical protein